MEKLTREDLAARCASTSFDSMHMDYENKKVVYIHSFRDHHGVVLEDFRTEVHFSALQPRPLTPAEERALLGFGLCHCTFVFLASAKHAQLMQVRAGYFSPDELSFFRPALAGALAEYFYLADLDLANYHIECCCAPPPTTTPCQPISAASGSDLSVQPTIEGAQTAAEAEGIATPEMVTPRKPPRVLVPFGGGKDSTLLMELLGRMGAQVGWAYFGEWVGSWEIYSKFTQLAAASPAATVFLAEQNLPCFERLKELNLVPELAFQDYCASVSFYTFASAFIALQQDFDYICVGNEYSANAINTVHPRYNYPVNHQYEKSFQAECAFHAYLRDYVHPRLYYFSGLQHMSELEIAMRFAAICAGKYLDLIISCNWAMDNNWCGGCEKCAFVFLLFAAFLPVPEIMSKVFGVSTDEAGSGGDTSSPIVPGSRESLRGVYDMYDSERHIPVFESLMGLAGHKPFECVGTPEECLAGMYLACERLGGGDPTSLAADADADADGHPAVQSDVDGSKDDPAEDSPSDKGDEKEQQQQQLIGKQLSQLLRKHRELICTKGKEEWEKIKGTIQTVKETGRPNVPTLYPDWFQLDV